MGIDDSNPWPNQGARWTAYHYREIIDGLRAGLDWREIARSIGRTEQAVRGRANLLIEDGPRGGGQAWKRLTERVLTDLDYDWETVARRKHAEKELAWWDETTESLVRAVWEASAPSRNWLRRNRSAGSGMADLTAAIGTSEAEICDRIVELGLATSYAEITDRLGCLPGGALEQRARLDRADSPAALYVLVAAGEFGDILHTSLHASRDDAEEARTKVEDRYSRRGPVTTRILRRVTGRLFGGD
ncbi:hypothetical protein, partial [Nocardia sp. 852002-51244_SCH5132740]|uniref:hypothetical protein n=1 Tax=Nocardia sp. 852002-51244_SCH5132740 TaxID=1834099 RepID=UPI0009ECD8E2